MKSIQSSLAIMALALFLSFNAFSQKVGFGVKGGFNLSTISDYSNQDDLKYGFQTGAYAIFKTSEKVALQSELMYSRQGRKVGGSNTVRYNYLNLPILVRVSPFKHFNIQAGPQVGLLASAKSKRNGYKTDASSHLRTFDFSLTGGVGISGKKVDIDFRYIHGAISTYKGVNGDNFANRVFQISIGYRIK